MHLTRTTLAAGLAAALLISAARGDDWPQWMGPKRDAVWRETGILEKFPEGGPKVLWRTPIKGGFAGPAVAGGKVFVMDYDTKADIKSLSVPSRPKAPIKGKERLL